MSKERRLGRGLEALLANREALGRAVSARAAALDPVLDFEMVTDNLDSFWHSAAVDSMQAYFRRILRGRYQEPPSTTFREVMNRLSSHPDAVTNPHADAPSAWLCSAKPDAYAVFLSDTDPVLGDDQRKFARDCGFPLKPAGAPGHTPLACRLKLFEEMIEQVAPKPVRAETGCDRVFRFSRLNRGLDATRRTRSASPRGWRLTCVPFERAAEGGL